MRKQGRDLVGLEETPAEADSCTKVRADLVVLGGTRDS